MAGPILEVGAPTPFGQTATPEPWSKSLLIAVLCIAGLGFAFALLGAAIAALTGADILSTARSWAIFAMAFGLIALYVTKPKNPLATLAAAVATSLSLVFGLSALFIASPETFRLDIAQNSVLRPLLAISLEHDERYGVLAFVAALIASLASLWMTIVLIIRLSDKHR